MRHSLFSEVKFSIKSTETFAIRWTLTITTEKISLLTMDDDNEKNNVNFITDAVVTHQISF